jgi:hypothetical protein
MRPSAAIRRFVSLKSCVFFVMIDTALRSRVERLLRGDIREQDFHHLFYSMRDASGGSGIVSEVVNFIGHPQRDQGLAHQEARDLFAFLKFRVPIQTQYIIPAALPPTVPDALRANLRRMRKSTLRRETHTNLIHAKRVLERILVRMAPTGFGGIRKPIILSREEYEVFMCVSNNLKGGPLFTAGDLFRDFSRILQKRDFLKVSEVPTLEKIKPAICLFALTVMHNRTIDLDDGTVAKVSIAPDVNGNLGTFAFAEIPVPGRSPRKAGAWLFETKLPIAVYCESGIVPIGRGPFIGDFEMTPQQTLARLT